jgi:lysophospholipase L1-like esterase
VLLAAPLSRADDGVQYYLSSGDSLAQGYQPIGGPSSPLGFPGYNQGYPDQLLKLVRDRYEQLRLVDVEGAFSSTDTTLVDGIPFDVARVCSWTWVCAPPPHGPDFHPNTDGYAAIAQALADVLP